MIKHQNLLNKTGLIINKYNQLLDNTGGRFNVFKTIGLTTEETRLHSAFLAELLDPEGSHGLKEKPLNAFIKCCLDNSFEFQVEQAKCRIEYYIGPKKETTGGQIDIIIKDNFNRAIIIENKINAKDQGNQMLRYYNHSREYTTSQLLYLSLEGKSPTKYSTGEKDFEYTTISYKYNILNWLTECKKIAIDFPLVREGINHYINLIKQLTNMSSMDEMKNEIVSLVMQSSENIQNAFELEKVLSDVKIKLQWEFWKQLEKSLKARNIDIKGDEDAKKVKHYKVRGYYEKQRNKDIYYGLWAEIYNENNITIHWGCEIDQNIHFGFTIEENGIGGISEKDEYSMYREIIKECDERYESTSDWLGRQYTDPQLNFREFNSEAVFSLTERSNLEDIANKVAEKATSDIDFLLNRIKA